MDIYITTYFTQAENNVVDEDMYNTTQVSSNNYEIELKRYIRAYYLLIEIVLMFVQVLENAMNKYTFSTKQVSFLYIYITSNIYNNYGKSYVHT